MSAPFRFKRFEVRQERAPMKVGTDGVLLGAWANVENARHIFQEDDACVVSTRILDVGTGTGLIALMMAQRFEGARVVGIDINEGAVMDAMENVERSEFRGRIEIRRCALQELSQGDDACVVCTGFDAVVCNPPYFVRSLKCPDEGRSEARHSDTLSLRELTEVSYRVLREGGRLSVILPYEQEGEFIDITCGMGFEVSRVMRVRPTERGEFKRVMIEVRKGYRGEYTEEEMFIEVSRHVYSERYKEMTKDFYLK